MKTRVYVEVDSDGWKTTVFQGGKLVTSYENRRSKRGARGVKSIHPFEKAVIKATSRETLDAIDEASSAAFRIMLALAPENEA